MRLTTRAFGLLALLTISTVGIGSVGIPKAISGELVTPITTASEPTDRPFEQYQGSFFDTSLSVMLSHLGVKVGKEDKVFAFPDPALGLGSQIRVYRAQQVIIQDGSSQYTIGTWSKTVQELINEQHIELADKDIIQPGVNTSLSYQAQPITITITRVAEAELSTTQAIPYTTQYVDDPALNKGDTQVTQTGQNGVLRTYFLVRRENGVEVSRQQTQQVREKEPVTEIIHRGTKVVDLGSGGASWYQGVGSMTAAHRTLPFGTKVRVVNVSNGQSVVVTIADRGPFVSGRIIDLSQDAFQAIAPLGVGVIQVRLEQP